MAGGVWEARDKCAASKLITTLPGCFRRVGLRRPRPLGWRVGGGGPLILILFLALAAVASRLQLGAAGQRPLERPSIMGGERAWRRSIAHKGPQQALNSSGPEADNDECDRWHDNNDNTTTASHKQPGLWRLAQHLADSSQMGGQRGQDKINISMLSSFSSAITESQQRRQLRARLGAPRPLAMEPIFASITAGPEANMAPAGGHTHRGRRRGGRHSGHGEQQLAARRAAHTSQVSRDGWPNWAPSGGAVIDRDARKRRAPDSAGAWRHHHRQHQRQEQNRRQAALLAATSGGLAAPSSPSSTLAGSSQCPIQCQCVWKNGKQFADCSAHGRSLHKLPEGLDPLLQVLNLSANHLPHLPNSVFVAVRLNNLQRIYLSSCQMESIDARAFDNLKLVVELDLSWNKLSSVPVPQMSQLSLLRKLTMRGNPLYALNEFTLAGGLAGDLIIIPGGRQHQTLPSAAAAGDTSTNVSTDDEPHTERQLLAAAFDEPLPLPLPSPSPFGAGKDNGGSSTGPGTGTGTGESSANSSNSHLSSGFSGWQLSLARNMSLLFETYPDLVRQLLARLSSPGSASGVGAGVAFESGTDDNFIIKSTAHLAELGGSQEELSRQALEWRALQLLRWLVQAEHEPDSDETEEGPDSVGRGSQSAPNEVAGALRDNELEPLPEFGPTNGEEAGGPGGEKAGKRRPTSLGTYFAHLQELDFGQCKLSYIKWTTFKHLKQLKRLLLDGNHLRQVSGKLVAAWPSGLHQLSLEENPWVCDCRLRPLKRWLLATRTPLRAPVHCQRPTAAEEDEEAREPGTFPAWERGLEGSSSGSGQVEVSQGGPGDRRRKPSEGGAMLVARADEPARLQSGSGRKVAPAQAPLGHLDQLTLDDFVCAPRAATGQPAAGGPVRPIWAAANLARGQQRAQSGGGGQEETELGAAASLSLQAAHEYLAPTLVSLAARPPRESAAEGRTQAVPLAQTKQHRPLVQAHEDERVTLRCRFLAYPASSVDLIWLADYNHQRRSQPLEESERARTPATSRLPAEERFIVLYDSKLHRPTSAGSASSSMQTLADDEENLSQQAKAGQAPGESHQERHNQRQQQRAGDLAGPKVHPPGALAEASLYGARILIKESRAATELQAHEATSNGINNYPENYYPDGAADDRDDESILKESILIIQSALVDDSARYKCIALNKAGNASLEFVLRVTHAPQGSSLPGTSREPHNPSYLQARDQRAQGSASPIANGKEPLRGSQLTSSQVADRSGGGGSQPSAGQPQPPAGWLKSSTTFQITIVVVSILMAAVIMAFLLFCIIIYQIQPSPGPNTMAPMEASSACHFAANSLQRATYTGAGSPVVVAANNKSHDGLTPEMANSVQHFQVLGSTVPGQLVHRPRPATFHSSQTSNGGPLLAAICDPITGRSPLHLLAHQPHLQAGSPQEVNKVEESALTWFA